MLKLSLLWTLCLLLFPILLVQGFSVKRRALRLPEAAGAKHGDVVVDGSDLSAFTIFGLGDSVTVGVGIDELENAITSQLAEHLSTQIGRSAHWRVAGQNGEKVEDLLRRVDGSLSEFDDVEPDLILVSIGVNDVTALTSVTRWHMAVVNLIGTLKRRYTAPIVFLGMPPIAQFPALPTPLRFALSVRARMLDSALKQAGSVLENVYWVSPEQLILNTSEFDIALMAADGFHPSKLGAQRIASSVVTQLSEQGLALLKR